MMTVGQRNLLERLAASRAARDLRSTVRYVGAGLTWMAFVIGVWVMIEWLIQIGAPAVARLMGWL